MARTVIAFFGVIVFVFLPGTASADTFYVDDDYDSSTPGWGITHFDKIQDGIDAALTQNNDIVLVMPGTYGGLIDFTGKALTVVSDQGPASTIIDGDHASYGAVGFESGEGRDSVLDGFTITNFTGTAVWCYQSTPTIVGNNIVNNGGHGIECAHNSAPLIKGNTISANSAGIYCDYALDTEILNNIINDNRTQGIAIFWDGSSVISHNVITGNHRNGIASDGSGVVSIDNNIISSNSRDGIALYDSWAKVISNNVIDNNADSGIEMGYAGETITNNIITRNSGGGIDCYVGQEPLNITNNTIAFNSADKGGGIFCSERSPAWVTNTILWGNTADIGPEIYVGETQYPAMLTISYSDVKGGQDSVHVESGCTLNWGPGMIDSDPLFVDPAAEDFHIPYTSPCRNRGSNGASDLPSRDFEGDPRIAWAGRTDIGADEFHFHLYHVGAVIPGSNATVRIVGLPCLRRVVLYLGSGLRPNPLHIPFHGSWHLELPLLAHHSVGPMPHDGIVDVLFAVPPQWSTGEEFYFQAHVGRWINPFAHLTNLMPVIVD